MNRLTEIENGLFFVVGCGRSGTTLLKSMLNAHPRIFIPLETNFFSGIAASYGVGSTPLEEKIRILRDKWWLNDLDLDAEVMLTLLSGKEASWSNVFLAMMASISEESPADRFGEKTVGHVNHAAQLLEIYPTCRIIQIIRDPRAAYASYRKTPIGSNFVSPFVAEWQNAVNVHHELTNHARYAMIRYEDLITDTTSVLSKLCQFLDLDYDETMMDFHQRMDPGYSPEQYHHQNTRKPITTGSLDKWRSVLTSGQVGVIQEYLGTDMLQLGYEPTAADGAMPRIRMMVSSCLEPFERALVRKPRQMRKAHRARKRQKDRRQQT